ARHRRARLRQAHARFRARSGAEDFDAFRERERGWLEDFALYSAIKDQHGGRPWVAWPAPLRDREPAAIAEARRTLADAIDFHAFTQWFFDRQCHALRSACAERGVRLVGDVPIFLAHDSADVWANRHLFFLDERGWPTVIAGVPPDYFSRTGQRWGNPLYRWQRMEEDGFAFWRARIRRALERFDLLRLDHFIGFVRYWEVPAQAPAAMEGAWREGPGRKLFAALREELGVDVLPFIAEDLGAITEEVVALREELGLPGMKILQFAFGDDPQADSFLPHNYTRNAVVYTGTHDNDTLLGWFTDEGGPSSTRTPEQCRIERE